MSGSLYGKHNKTVSVINANCDGSEIRLDDCDTIQVTQVDNNNLQLFDAAGVQCNNATVSATGDPLSSGVTSVYGIATWVVLALLIALIVVFTM